MKELLCPHFTPSRRQPQCCRRRAGREAGSVSNASRAVRPGRKTRPLLRCPARPSAGAAASALPTAAPKNPPCIRRRRRSDFLPTPFGARVQIPANKVKRPALSCGEEEPQQNECAAIFTKRIAASDIPLAAMWRRRRDLNLLRRPSCGARRGHRRAQPPWPCRPLRQKILAAPAAAAGREAGSASSACRAVRPGRKTWPLLRCPARPSAGAAASALPTAAPKNPPCIRRRRQSDFLPAPFGARVQIPANKVKSPALSCGAFSGGEGGI